MAFDDKVAEIKSKLSKETNYEEKAAELMKIVLAADDKKEIKEDKLDDKKKKKNLMTHIIMTNKQILKDQILFHKKDVRK